CSDCISSVGNLKVDLDGVYLASGASGKGLGSYAGIAMVYYQDEALEKDTKGIPRYFDLRFQKESKGVPFTMNTNLFYALRTAFRINSTAEHRAEIKELSDFMFDEVEKLGINLLWSREKCMPGVLTIKIPEG